MKHHQLRGLLPLCLLAAAHASAAVRYVNVNNASPAPPYTSWSTAATTIQDAVDAAVAGDPILVTTGVYQSGSRNQSRVEVDKAVTVQNVNGPQFTAIEGGLMIRCVFLANGTFLAGFTLTNGNVFFGGNGGGVAFDNLQSDAIGSNCVIVGCAAGYGGGAASALLSGGSPGLNGGTLINCTFTRNGANGTAFGFQFPPASGGAADGCRLINLSGRWVRRVTRTPMPSAPARSSTAWAFSNDRKISGTTARIRYFSGTSRWTKASCWPRETMRSAARQAGQATDLTGPVAG
jgi:hypothetical protein